MPRVDHLIGKNQKGATGKNSPSVAAFINPRPQLKSLTTLISIKQTLRKKQNPRGHSRVFALPISNGASPIASALGIRLGATPGEHIHTNSQLQFHPAKQDISTLPGLGHFSPENSDVRQRLGGAVCRNAGYAAGWRETWCPNFSSRLTKRLVSRSRSN